MQQPEPVRTRPVGSPRAADAKERTAARRRHEAATYGAPADTRRKARRRRDADDESYATRRREQPAAALDLGSFQASGAAGAFEDALDQLGARRCGLLGGRRASSTRVAEGVRLVQL